MIELPADVDGGRPVSEPRSLVLLRHGRTAHNAAGRIQGQVDVDLDDTGHDQAARAAVAVAALAPGRAVVLRPRPAPAPRRPYVAKETGLEPTYDARLREFFLGEREGLTHAEFAEPAPEEFARFRLGDFDAVAGGEATAAVASRMSDVLGELLAVTPAGGTAVAVSHGAAIRTAVTALLGWPLSALCGPARPRQLRLGRPRRAQGRPRRPRHAAPARLQPHRRRLTLPGHPGGREHPVVEERAPATVVEERAQRASRDPREHPGGRGASASHGGRGASASERHETPREHPGGRGASAASVTRPGPGGRGASASERHDQHHPYRRPRALDSRSRATC